MTDPASPASSETLPSDLVRERLAARVHGLHGALTPLAGYVRLLRAGKLGPLTAEQQTVLDAMVRSTERLAAAIEELPHAVLAPEGSEPAAPGEPPAAEGSR